MLQRIFPQSFDNHYRGHKSALLLLAVITIFNSLMFYQAVFNSYYAAGHIDNIPLGTPESAVQIVSLFTKLGNVHFVFIILAVLALIRYRSMVALVFLLQIYEYVTRKIINNIYHDSPYFRLPTDAANAIVQSLFYAMLIGFVLSIWWRDDAASADVPRPRH